MGTTSDHAALHLQLTNLEKRATPFKFYISWLLEDDFSCRFRASWNSAVSGTPLFKLQAKINAVRAAGKEWAKIKRNATVTPSKVAADRVIEDHD